MRKGLVVFIIFVWFFVRLNSTDEVCKFLSKLNAEQYKTAKIITIPINDIAIEWGVFYNRGLGDEI
jgi:hypothetical protein